MKDKQRVLRLFTAGLKCLISCCALAFVLQRSKRQRGSDTLYQLCTDLLSLRCIRVLL